jgi:hypothetical protein
MWRKSPAIFMLTIFAICAAAAGAALLKRSRAQAVQAGGRLAAEAGIMEALAHVNAFLEERAETLERTARVEFDRKYIANGIAQAHIIKKDGGFHLVDSPVSRRETLFEELLREAALEALKEAEDAVFPESSGISADFRTDGIMVASSSGDASAEAFFRWIQNAHEELAEPAFRWRRALDAPKYAISSAGDVFLDGAEAEDGALSGGAQEWLQNFDPANAAGLRDVGWTRENPVIVGSSLNVDVSELYGPNGEPVPTCVICLEKDLILYASRSDRAGMRGAVLSLGGLRMMGVAFEGTAASLEDAYALSGSAVLEPDMLFRVKPADRSLEFAMLDAFTGSALSSSAVELGSLKRIALSEETIVERRPAFPLSMELGDGPEAG